MKRRITIIILFLSTVFLYGQNKDLVIAELNYCTTTLYNIENNGSIESVEHELWQIDVNLKRKTLAQIDEAADFVIALESCLNKMKINETEKYVVNDILARKRENAIWESLSGALSPTMVITSGSPYQIAANGLLTAARAAVEYKSAQNSLDIEELREMWAISKRSMEAVSAASERSLDLSLKMFRKYNLDDSDRIDRKKAKDLLDALDLNPQSRVQRLEDLNEELASFMDYHYYLGMAYLDNNQWPKAKQSFNTYESMYAKAPVFNYDEKTGCIALAKLANETGASSADKRSWIKIARNNLKDNGPVEIQCAMVYLKELKDYYTGLDILREAIVNPSISDNMVLVRLVGRYMDQLKKNPSLMKKMDAAVANCRNLDIQDYMGYLVAENSVDMWKRLDETINVGITVIKYLPKNKSTLSFPDNFTVDIEKIDAFMASGDNGLIGDSIHYGIEGVLSASEIYSNLSVIKKNPELKSLFFDKVGNDAFIVRNSVTKSDIINSDIMGISSYGLKSSQKKQIADFCEEKKAQRETGKLKLLGETYMSEAMKRKVLSLWHNIADSDMSSVVSLSSLKKDDSKIVFFSINQGEGIVNMLFFRQIDDSHMEPYAIRLGDVFFFRPY